MISFEEALACVLSHAPKLGTIKVSLLDAVSCILKEDLWATRPFPPFDRVAMDGIAVNALDGTSFKSDGVQYAGERQRILKNKGACCEVTTGAILPRNAQAVIRAEDLEKTDGLFRLKPGVKISPYQNIHRKGSDAEKHALLLSKGAILTPPCIALIASLGMKEVLVQKPPRIAILSTGDELIAIGSEPKPHQIFSSNAEAIFAATGSRAKMLYAKDSLESIQRALEEGLEDADLLIISGGVSFGGKDLVPAALEKAGVEELFHGVWQKPGKPFWFGKTKRGQPVFGLPGNPAAMLVSLYLYVLPLLSLAKETDTILGEEVGPLSTKYAHFILAKIDRSQAVPLRSNGSGDLVSLAKADGFILPSTGKKGEMVRLWKW